VRKRTVAVLGAVGALVVAGSLAFAFLGDSQDAVEISLASPEGAPSAAADRAHPMRIAVSAMTSPKQTFEVYRDILDYVAEKSGRPVELVQRETYEEINDLIESGDLDMAFVCTGAYIEGHDTFGMEILAAPVAYGEPVYYSYTIVPASSTATEFEDLRGSTFAFTDPMSNTGTLVPTYLLGRMNETPESFFGEFMYTYSHDRSIQAVSDGIVDAAAIDSLIYDFMKADGDAAVENTRVLAKSPPYGIPPVVVHPDLDPAVKAELRAILLGMHEDPAGRAILQGIQIDRFDVLGDGAYDSVREMQVWLDANLQTEQ